ncbi:response regulator [Candidatus Calescamantes bacterium]|nr:response regulator [Candidatus Calescamantes bacterium]
MKGKRILLVEDNPEIRQVVKTFLEQVLEVEVIEAKDGVEALMLLRNKKPEIHAAILDIMMRSHGGTVRDFLKKNPQYKDVPIIYHTGLEEEQLDKRILEGAYFVHKNGQSMFKLKEILTKILR